jgi:hypothetical protein
MLLFGAFMLIKIAARKDRHNWFQINWFQINDGSAEHPLQHGPGPLPDTLSYGTHRLRDRYELARRMSDGDGARALEDFKESSVSRISLRAFAREPNGAT